MEKGIPTKPGTRLRGNVQDVQPRGQRRPVEVELANHMAHRAGELVAGVRSDDLVWVHPGMDHLEEHHNQGHQPDANMTR